MSIQKRFRRRAIDHWRTTLAGAIGAGCTVVGGMIAAGTLDRFTLGLAFVVAVIGAISKDPG